MVFLHLVLFVNLILLSTDFELNRLGLIVQPQLDSMVWLFTGASPKLSTVSLVATELVVSRIMTLPLLAILTNLENGILILAQTLFGWLIFI
jgi:hypothetical protein